MDEVNVDAAAAVRLLGPVEVEVAGQRVVLERRQERCLLAVLLLEHGRAVSVDRLGDLLWNGDPPERFRSLLHTQASRVRAALRAVGADDWISSSHGGYLAGVPDEAVDVDRFRGLTERASTTDDPVERAALWRRGLNLWRGPALADLGSDRLRQRLCAELDELRLVATEEWLAARLEAGQSRGAIGELARLTGEHPLRERPVDLYMRALAGSGRAAEALTVFDEFRDRLAEETGLDPGPELSRTQLQVLRGELSTQGARDEVRRSGGRARPEAAGRVASIREGLVALAEPAGHTSPRRGAAGDVRVHQGGVRPCQLPRDVADFTGRGEDVERIRVELSEASTLDAGRSSALVISAVAGQAGIGKTALAVHVAHLVRDEYPDGQLYVNLRGAEQRPVEPGEVLAQFLRALGVPGEAVPESVDERAAMYRSLLADRRVLVVLDNAVDEGQVWHLIPGTAGAGVLITSRRRLAGVPGASVLSLDVLDEDHAIDLLRRVIGVERVGRELDAAAELVRLCAGLPLALRVVGARLAAHPHWSLGRMVERLGAEHRRLDELAYADLEVRASVGLSYQRLDGSDQRLWRRLALLDAQDFPGWVAAAVLDSEHEEGLAALDRLVEVHLIDVVGTDQVGQVRYRFHDLVRLYGRERCAEEEPKEERTAALARAVGGWLVLSQRARVTYYGNDYLTRLREAPRWNPDKAVDRLVARESREWLLAERATLISGIHQAAEVGLASTCWELAAATETVLRVGSYVDDWCGTFRLALQVARSVASRRGEAVALTRLGSALLEQSRFREAYDLASQAEKIFIELGDQHGWAHSRWIMAWVERNAGDWNVALADSRRLAATFREFEDLAWEALALRNVGMLYLAAGRPDEALPELRRAELVAKRVGSRYLGCNVAFCLGEAYVDLGRFEEAEQVLEAALDDVRQTGSATGEATILYVLGRLALGRGRYAAAKALLLDSRRICGAVRESIIELRTLRALADVHVAEDDVRGAVDVLRRAVAVANGADSPKWRAEVLDQLAAAYEATGDVAAAGRSRAEALRVRAGSGPRQGFANSPGGGSAEARSSSGDDERGTRSAEERPGR